jgi:hypothetical protein
MYAKIENGAVVKYPYMFEELQADHPDVVFSMPPTEEELAACGVKVPVYGAPITRSSRTHIFNAVCTLNEANDAVVNYEEIERPLHEASFNMRDARNSALTRCDWVITRAFEEGTPVPPAYLAYRQALRDLPSQAGFPYNYVWPEAPL